jgi:aromatic-L-amino-acid decarboxylase
MREMVDRAMERIVDHIETLSEQPAAYANGGKDLARKLVEEFPEYGAPFEKLLDRVFVEALPTTFNTAGPGYLAYIPGGGLFHAAVADLIADAINRYVGVWLPAPGLVQLESNVIRWFCDIVGYPQGAGGVLTTGGSMANLIAIVTARRERLPEAFLNGTVYASDQTHHSVQKAAVMAGIRASHVRSVPSDDLYRIRAGELERLIQNDRRNGLEPFLVVDNAGTTNTGAVDDLNAVADIASKEGLWLHTDAAYGGFFALTKRGREILSGLDRSDSICLDPHKSLFLPYGNGSLLVRDSQTLLRAHSTFAEYMPPMQDDREFVDFCQVSPELSRDFRGLRAWLPIRVHGFGVFREALDEKMDLTLWAADRLREMPNVRILAEPQLSVVAFRCEPGGLEGEVLNEFNRTLLRRINDYKRVYLTGTMLGDVFALRICVLSFRTHHDRVAACIQDIEAAIGEMMAELVT